MKKISIVSPFYNELGNLPLFKQRVFDALQATGVDAELVLVDDHSTDDGAALVAGWAAQDPRIVYIRLSRNCGSHAACSAGLLHCTGDCAVLMAVDLQDPPESIPELLEHWRAGNDVVWAARKERKGETWSTKLFAGIYYRLMRRFALPEMPVKGADFLLMDRKVIDAYNAIPEKNTSFLAMILWLGFRQTSIEYVKQERHSGRSKWSLSRKFKVFIDSFISFSYAPIRLMSLAGAAIGLLGFLYALIVVFNAFRGFPIEGWSSLMVVVLMLGGFQLLMLGVLGEYLWRAFDEARGRPRYVIEEFQRLAGKGMPPALNGDARATRPAQAAPAGPNPEAVRRETAPFVKTQSVGERP
jgi:dolichol-phosphate mannosyltransferase